MGWQFTLAEWLGGIVLIAVMTRAREADLPASELVEEARRHVDEVGGHDHGSMESEGATVLAAAARSRHARRDREELRDGFLDAVEGSRRRFHPRRLARRIRPQRRVETLFLNGAPPAVRLVENAVVGPLIAIFSFVCSIGNVPLAAILWTSGISFGGVLAFLYADLIVLPLLDVYRKYYGVRMMLYIFGIFFATMVISAIFMDGVFSALHMVPRPNPNIRADLSMFSFDYTFYLNLIFGALALYLWRLDVQNPMDHCAHHDHPEHAEG